MMRSHSPAQVDGLVLTPKEACLVQEGGGYHAVSCRLPSGTESLQPACLSDPAGAPHWVVRDNSQSPA
eukprot:scaffold104_cov375-Prasinococcus_capsulatus_cf.AAC.21